MNTTLLFLVPIGLAAVAWTFCFVGCKFPTTGTAYGMPYSNQIIGSLDLIAYWPLNDIQGIAPQPSAGKAIGIALDLSGNMHNGTYINPPPYPKVAASTPFTNPTVTLQQPSIVAGDALQSGSKVVPASAEFQGGYVSIPWSTQNSPSLPQFTFEAWIKPSWPASTKGIAWVVFSALQNNTGFSVFINPSNQWQINAGDGTQVNPFPTNVSFTPDTPTYVAVTFTSGPNNSTTGMLTLWINPDNNNGTSTPTPAFPPIPATYVGVDPTQPVTFFIGAGLNDQPLRTSLTDTTDAPLYPFQGWIQSVALYNVPLSATAVGDDYEAGSGAEES